MIEWIYYPNSRQPSDLARKVVKVFSSAAKRIDSANHELNSNNVLVVVTPGLKALGFKVETGKTADAKVNVPVLFGREGRIEKSFDADAWHEEEGFVVEVEAGRGVVNNQFLKDLFQACMMVGVNEIAIAIRSKYRNSKDFERVCKFFNTLYTSRRLQLPLEGILIIGY
jgi:hypothetical protein